MEIVESVCSVYVGLYAASDPAGEGVGKSPGHTQMGEMVRIFTEDAHVRGETRRHMHTDASLNLSLKYEDDSVSIYGPACCPARIVDLTFVASDYTLFSHFVLLLGPAL